MGRSRGGSPRSSFRRVREVGGTRKVYERERSRADYRRVVWAGWERRVRCEGRWTATRPFKGEEESGRRSTYRLEFVTQGCVALPDNVDGTLGADPKEL